MQIGLMISYKPTHILCTFHRKASNVCRPISVQCTADRRSGNYQPSHWDFDSIQSLSTQYKEEKYLKRASELVGQVRSTLMLDETTDRLELIDDLQNLGISCHFEGEIDQILGSVYDHKYCNKECWATERDLYTTSLEFRLLRQHGFNVSQEVFDCFKNENGGFKSGLGCDIKGLLQLYEASFLLSEGEKTLEIAKEFATICLQKKLDDDEDDVINEKLSLCTHRSLKLPIYWRVRRPNVRWYIDAYETRHDMNPRVLQLARLDFNIVQATYQQELKHVSRWWKSTRLAEKLPFARDRVVECYFWSVGVLEPREYGYQRIMTTKINAFITIIDDIFDVYGTLEELQLFNNIIQRWDTESIKQLPDYMQICYLALYNFVHDMAYDVLKDQGFIIIPYLRKSWEDLSATHLQEAKWYYDSYKPRLEEYLNNAWISVTAPTILSQIYFLVTNPIQNEDIESLYKYHDIVRWSAMIFRLANDSATSVDEVKRGDVPKSIECYMNEKNVSEKEAQEHIRFMIWETWKKMNKEIRASDSPFGKEFIECAVNLGRMAQFMYKDGDGHGMQHSQIHDHITHLLFEPYEGI